jgi:hypothetical protein
MQNNLQLSYKSENYSKSIHRTKHKNKTTPNVTLETDAGASTRASTNHQASQRVEEKEQLESASIQILNHCNI